MVHNRRAKMLLGEFDFDRSGGGGFSGNRGPTTIYGSTRDNPSSTPQYWRSQIDYIRDSKAGSSYSYEGGKGYLGGDRGQYFGWGETSDGYPCNGLYNVQNNYYDMPSKWYLLPACP
jgi:hypothetical protein